MTARKLPVRPNLDQLKNQAKDLLRAVRRGEADAIADFQNYHPQKIEAARAKLADAQLVLARSYGVPTWPRLAVACKLIDGIWKDDVEAVRKIVARNPELLHEPARAKDSNWGPPMTYAANVGHDAIIKMLHEMGATDLETAIGRAALQSKVGTARMLHEMAGRPKPPADCLGGPAYTLSAPGTALMFELGAKVRDENGKQNAPVGVVLCTDGRNPAAKHEILRMYVEHGVELPDTAPMAMHRGRIDLLEEHLRRDPLLLQRTFTHQEIFPPELGCLDEIHSVQGTPLNGATLLHLCVDYDEREIAEWLLKRGMNQDAKAAVDADGFGGHTALFAAVVSYAVWWKNFQGAADDGWFARLLLDRGADPNARASLRKQMDRGDFAMHEYRDVTPVSWGERFCDKLYVSDASVKFIIERGGRT